MPSAIGRSLGLLPFGRPRRAARRERRAQKAAEQWNKGGRGARSSYEVFIKNDSSGGMKRKYENTFSK